MNSREWIQDRRAVASAGFGALIAGSRAVLRLLLTSHDVSTEIGRARERQRHMALTALASVLAKAITVSTGLISVPLTLHYLGPERYGMWMTMSTIIALLSFADLGIGNGLLSSIATANGRDDRSQIKALVSTAYLVLSSIALIVVGIFAGLYAFVDWSAVFNVKTAEAAAEAGPSLAALIGCFALAMPLGVVQRTQMALQRGFMGNLWQCFDSLVGLAAVMTAIRFEAPLPFLVLGFAGAPQLANILNSVLFFGWLRPDIAPRPRLSSWHLAQSIAGTGVLFLVLQVVGSVTYASDGIIISQLLGATAVAEYAVPQKLFGVIGTVLSMVLAPLWPAYGEAIACGDHAWVLRTLKQSLVLSMAAAAALSLPLVVFGPQIITLWVGSAVAPAPTLLIGFGVWKIVEAWGMPMAMYLNGTRVIGFQVVTAVTTAICAPVLKIILIVNLGVEGAVDATVIAYVLFVVLPTIVWRKKLGLTKG
jgi:O-antigen/teichoic acid export membrane protein